MFFVIRANWYVKIRVVGPQKYAAALRKLESELSYHHKYLDPVLTKDGRPTGKRETVKEKQALFTKEDLGPVVEYTTYQGFYRRITALLRQYGDVHVTDNRLPLPEPALERCGGFRFSQERLFKEFLSYNESGVFEAVTRWGKSRILLNWIHAYPSLRILYLAPGIDLLNQTYQFLCSRFGQDPKKPVRRGGAPPLVGRVYASKHMIGSKVTLGSLDSLGALTDLEMENFQLAIIDETHAAVSPERAPQLSRLKRARIYAATATPYGRYDNADILLEGLIGPVLTRRTYLEAVAAQEIAPIRVYLLKMPLKFRGPVRTRNKAYDLYHYFNPMMRRTVEMLFSVLPKEWQTLAFIDTEKQAEFLLETMSEFTVAIAKRFKNKTEREEVQAKMASGEILRCFATGIYSQGVTFSDLRVMVNLAAGGGSITSIQRPGRLAEIVPGKKRGYMVDFMFYMDSPEAHYAQVAKSSREWNLLIRDSVNRLKVYKRIGYEIVEVDRIRDMIFE